MRSVCLRALPLGVILATNRYEVEARRYAVSPRQDITSSPSSTPQTTSSLPSQTSGISQSHNGGSSTISSTTDASSSTGSFSLQSATQSSIFQITAASASPTTTSQATASSSTMATLTSSLSPTANISLPGTPDGGSHLSLPLRPMITPALSVASAVLILSGVVYTLIGIKNKRVHTFLSTAYLTSLAVVVLVIYVMNPPISNAIQGAYFVAACITGVLFGIGSLVFQEITEGLGCLLGGFCLGMWFLVLRPGGLIHSSSGVIAFIVAFTLTGYAFAFSSYTRPHGLIWSTSFAGATIIVLGVDCFSRAGLKEFWLYIWNLNINLFPLGTTTYPITRGMRVEIASIILVFLIGVMSQIKIWNVVKKRREQRATDQMEDARRREQAEEDMGRMLEEGNQRERAQWEAVYDGKARSGKRTADSGIGTGSTCSSHKSSMGLGDGPRNNSAEGVEMIDLDHRSGSEIKGPHAAVTVNVVQEDDALGAQIGEFNPHGLIGTTEPANQSEISRGTSPDDHVPGSSLYGTATKILTENSTSAGPKVVPLPFTVHPVDSDSESDRTSVIMHIPLDDPDNKSTRKKLSRSSLLRPSSRASRRPPRHKNVSEEALIAPHADDDRASSIAATINDADDDTNSWKSGPRASSTHSEPQSKEHLQPGGSDRPVDIRFPNPLSENSTTEVFRSEAENGLENSQSAINDSSIAAPEAVDPEASRASLSQLPTGEPKVAKTYRTNEWAKHLDRAEQPQLEQLKLAKASQGLAPDAESAAPVYLKELRETPLTTQIANQDRRSSQKSIYQSAVWSPPDLGAQKSSSGKAVERKSSDTSLNVLSKGLASSHPLVQAVSYKDPMMISRGYRSSSTPLSSQMLVQSSIEEDAEASFSPRIAPSPLPTNTLMAKRDNMMRNRSTISHTSISNLTLTPDDSASIRSSLEDDNISLSQRRSLLKSQLRQSSLPISLRQPSNPQEHLASFRHSVRQDLVASQAPNYEIDARRSNMINERRQSALNKLQAAAMDHWQKSMQEQEMRRGGLLEAHRDVMRRMQEDANRRMRG